jgi:electron-transferring-flavoprotein dehydrogenase
MVVGLDYRDVELSVHDLLQELKTHREDPEDPRGRRARAVGREDDSRGRVRRAAEALACAGAAAVRRRRRPRERAGAEGDPLRDRVGPPRRRGGVATLSAARRRAARSLVRRVGARELHLERPARGAQHAPGVRPRLLRRRRAGERDDATKGKFPPGDLPTERDAEQPLLATDRAKSYPVPDGQADVRQALERVRVGQPHARRPAEPHPRAATVPRDVAEMWAHMCPAQVYEVGEPTATEPSRSSSRRRTACSAARSPPRAAA